MKETIEQIGDQFGVTVRYRLKGAVVDFFAAEIISVSEAGQKYYSRKGAASSLDDTEDFNEAERLVEGSVKWDGCSHYYFGDETGYLHLCGSSSIYDLGDTVKLIYERCGELMQQEGGHLLPGEFDCAPPR